MSTSTLPVHLVPVSDMLYHWAQEFPGVYCNLRPYQQAREEMEQHFMFADSEFVHKPVRRFLEALPPKSKVLMYFQGYRGEDLGTVLVTIDKVFWTSEPYPRLDFKHSPEFDQIHGGPNFWGAFILLITAARNSDEDFVREDRHGTLFLHAVEAMGLGTEPFYATEGVFTEAEKEAVALLHALVNDPRRLMLNQDIFLGSTTALPDEAPGLGLSSRGLETMRVNRKHCTWEGSGIIIKATLEVVRKFRLDPETLLKKLVSLADLESRLS